MINVSLSSYARDAGRIMVKRAKPMGEGRRIALLSRTTPEMRSRLDQAAADSGRSLAQEVETRLEQSFLAGDILEKLFGGPNTLKFFLARALALQQMVAERRDGAGDDWIEKSDEEFREQIADEFQTALENSHLLVAPLNLDEITATRSRGKAKMPEGLSFATPEEAAQTVPVKLRRIRNTKA